MTTVFEGSEASVTALNMGFLLPLVVEMTTELEGDFSVESAFGGSFEMTGEFDDEFLFMMFSLWGVRLSKLLWLRRTFLLMP